MNPLIEELIDKIETETNPQEQEELLMYVTQILEMNTFALSERSRIFHCEHLVPWHLCFIALPETEQSEIAKKLSQIFIESERILHGVLWALGKTTGRTGLLPLLQAIYHRCQDFDDHNDFQAAVSLQKCLYNFEDEEVENYPLLRDEKIVDFMNGDPEFYKA